MAYPDTTDQTTQDQTAPQPPQPVPQPALEARPDYTGAWRDWLTNPENRASMMQFGISLLQPIGVGQSQAGHFGQAVGQAGEAAGRVRGEQMAQQKLGTETQLREAQANLATERAAMAGQNLTLQQEMLELKRMLGTSAAAEKLQEKYYNQKLLGYKGTLADYVQENQQAIKAIQQQEGIRGAPVAGAGATPRPPPQAGEIQTYQGRQYRFKGGANVQGNWEPI